MYHPLKFTKIGIVPKLNDPLKSAVKDAVSAITEFGNANNLETSLDPEEFNEETLIVALGGDGTMIQALKHSVASHGICVGFNLGNVGFLTDYSGASTDTIITELHSIIKRAEEEGRSIIDQMPVLYVKARINEKEVDAIAINDIAISGAYADSMVSYRMLLDGKNAGVHKANGVIISTPQGSTAYGLSVGGSIIHPDSPVMQIAPVAPIHLTSRPITVPQTSFLRFFVESRAVSIRTDGQLLSQVENMQSPTVQNISVRLYDIKANIIRPPEWNFFQTLSHKLHWNE